MKRIALPGILLLITFLALAAANDHAFCGQMRKISLTDGSVLYGEIAGFNDGVYSVQTKDAGLLQIEEANVRSIGMIGNQAAEAPKEEEYSGPSQAVVQAGVDALKRAMQNNPAVMGSIEGLQDDPAFMEILSDPEIMQAVETNDIKTLMSNPKFMELLDSDDVVQISIELEGN